MQTHQKRVRKAAVTLMEAAQDRRYNQAALLKIYADLVKASRKTYETQTKTTKTLVEEEVDEKCSKVD